MHGSRGCLGCFTKPSLIIAVDEPSKGLRIQGRPVKKSSISEDVWSSSTIEMENGGLPSQRSISSITTSNHPHATPTSTSNPHEFVNYGLLLWNQTRQQWLGNKKSQIKTQSPEPRISWNATYESLLGTSKSFPHPIPLSEMIDFLVDIWEQEGLYDWASENLNTFNLFSFLFYFSFHFFIVTHMQVFWCLNKKKKENSESKWLHLYSQILVSLFAYGVQLLCTSF